MKTLTSISLLLVIGILVSAAPARPRPEILGISLDMKRDVALVRLKAIGSLEREARKKQEVWAVKDARISHLLVGYDMDDRVRYVTAIARTDGPRIGYHEIANMKSAQRNDTPGNGLGLFLAKYFVELHNGRIEVESEINKGSTFSVRLPMNLDLEPEQADQSGGMYV